MIISRGRRYIFVHIPKTGGTALSLALEARAMKDDILIGDTPKAVRRRARVKNMQASGRLWKHSRISDIQGLVCDEELVNFFVFTLVRNPWDRMVSYYHWLREERFQHPAVIVAKAHGFSEFLNHRQTVQASGGDQFGHYVTDQQGVDRCNLFARIENLQQDLAPLEAHLGFSLAQIDRVNTSQRDRDYRRYFSDDDADLVANLWAADIQRFGYAF